MPEIVSNGLLYILTGFFAGFMSGIMGIGGGIVVVPALLLIFHHNPTIPTELTMPIATGCSLAIMIVTSQASIRAHLRLGDVLWIIYQRLWPGLLAGALVGALLAERIPAAWLKLVFAVFLILVACKMLFNLTVTHPQRFPPFLVNSLVSFIIGLKSGLLGIGGGTLIIPYLTYCGVEVRKMATITALCTLTVSLVGTVAFIVTGINKSGLPPYSSGYVYWPAVVCTAIPSSLAAPFAARLTYVLPIKQLKYGFIIILLLTALHLLL